MDLIIDGVRWVLWLLVKGCLFLIDSVYNIIQPILTFDIGSNSIIWKWWAILCIFLFIFTFFRMLSMFFKSSVDEEYTLKLNPINSVVRIVVIAVVIALMPTFVKYFTSLSASMMENATRMFSVEDSFVYSKQKTDNPELQEQLDKLYEEYDGMPSQIFISSASNGKYPPYQLIDINKTEGGMDSWFDGVPVLGGVFNITSALLGQDGDYVYFPDTTMLIFLIIEGFCGMYLFLLMAIQIAQRMFSIGVKILISPYPVSGIVNPDDRSFGLWIKLLSADLISNVLQYIILLLVMAITSSTTVQNFGIVGQGIFFLGGMLAVLIGPGQVSQIIGGDGMGLFMTMQGFQAMSALKGITQSAINKTASLAGGAAALGVYGAGRAAGLKSLGNFPDSGAGGGFGGINSPGSPNGHSPSGGRPGGGKPGGDKSLQKFSDPVTDNQVKAGMRYDLDLSNMSKGEASLALEKAGMEESYWHGMNSNGGATGTINKATDTYGFGNTPASISSGYDADGSAFDPSQAYDSDAGMPGGTQDETTDPNSAYVSGAASQSISSETGGNTDVIDTRISREGTLARRVGNQSNIGARVVSKAARSAYISAGSRLMGQKSIVRGGRYIYKSTSAQKLSNLHAGVSDLRHPETIPPVSTVQNEAMNKKMQKEIFKDNFEDLDKTSE